ncbi:response regulator transcription factor [Bifidobacterium breve]|uniref:response regulator transcription factor n=1 Tax=Bifidobacterium breve TaxID=1685 RepID=UPI0030F44893
MPDISGRDGSKPTMLIMDNDRMALMALQSILAKALPDFELLPPVSEGSKAIQLCTATKRPPAVLLADIAMNDINGPDVVRAIRRENATTAILAITASIVGRHAKEMARAGAQGIMSKNDDVRLQAVAIRQVQAGKTWGDGGDVRFETAAVASARIKAEKDNRLSAREMEVAELWSRGRTMPQIAAELSITETTVRTHLRRAADKLGAGNLKELIGAWIRMNLH